MIPKALEVTAAAGCLVVIAGPDEWPKVTQLDLSTRRIQAMASGFSLAAGGTKGKGPQERERMGATVADERRGIS